MSFKVPSPHNLVEETTLEMSGDELVKALQYDDTAGSLPLRNWLLDLREAYHDRKRSDEWSICLGVGRQDLLYKVGSVGLSLWSTCLPRCTCQAVFAVVNPAEPVLTESPAYVYGASLYQIPHLPALIVC